MKVLEAFEKGLIPEDYRGIVPFKCKCGCELEVNETLAKLYCPSDKCIGKQIARMNDMLTNFGVKNIGISYCADLWHEMVRCGLGDSHMNIFLLPFDEYPRTYNTEVTLKKFNEIQRVVKESIFNHGYSLGELAANMALPGLDLNARKLFAGFNSIQEMQSYAHKKYGKYGLLDIITDRFGSGVNRVKMAHIFSTFGRDIAIAQNIFGMRKAVSREIRVAITGRISAYGSYTRKAFLAECNRICDGIAEILDVNPSSSIEFVIADDYIDSSTYAYGEEYGIIVSSTEFVNWLKDEVI